MINVGKIVSTHGIKGELRILSDFEYKDKVFVVGNELIINNKPYKIRTYRRHKNFDMVTLDSELMTYKVISTDGMVGSVLEIFFASPSNKIIRVMLDKEYLIPVNSPILVSIDKKSKIIEVDLVEGM